MSINGAKCLVEKKILTISMNQLHWIFKILIKYKNHTVIYDKSIYENQAIQNNYFSKNQTNQHLKSTQNHVTL